MSHQVQAKIRELIEQALAKLDVSETKIYLEHPAEAEHGDYASNVALQVFGRLEDEKRQVFGSPRQLAEKIAEQIVAQFAAPAETGGRAEIQTETIEQIKTQPETGGRSKLTQQSELIKRVEVAGPGFINFTLSEHFLLEELQRILTNCAQSAVDASPNSLTSSPADSSTNSPANSSTNSPADSSTNSPADSSPNSSPDLSFVSIAGTSSALHRSLPQVNTGKKIIVEYSSPNIAKPFTIGHLRSTIIGDAVANLLAATGATVLRDNHLGDWGTQFGKQIYAIKTWGDEAEIEQSDCPVKKLVELYVKFHQEAERQAQAQQLELEEKGREWFKKLEDGDAETRRLWQKCINWSWREFSVIYDRLGVKFSPEFNHGRGLGESFFEDQLLAVVELLKEGGWLKKGEHGARLVFFPDDKYPPAMILKQDGATLYHTRDLATDKYRLDEYQPDLIINEVGAEQELYFQQLFEMERLLGWFESPQRIHIKHGLYRFTDQKMSTRRGNVIWLEEVLQEAFERAEKIAGERLDEESLWQVAVGALKWNDLKRKPELNVVFDWDEVVKLDGNSGPYVQYTFVRAFSVLDKAGSGVDKTHSGLDQAKNGSKRLDLSVELAKLSALERQLLSQLMQWDERVELAAVELSPHQICTYLFELAQTYNSFYTQHPILQAETRGQRQLRLQLTQATAATIQTGLSLLGIETLKMM